MGKNLDEELAEAAGIDDDGNDLEEMGVVKPSHAPLVAEQSPRGNIGLLATLLVMVGAIVVLFLFGLKEAPIYSMSLADFMAKGALDGRRVRVEGELVPGTLMKRNKPCEFRFMLRDIKNKETPHLAVRFPQCIVPDTFRDMPEGGTLVTAEGSMSPEGHFEATEIMAKCSSKYNPETHELGAAKQAKAEPAGQGAPAR